MTTDINTLCNYDIKEKLNQLGYTIDSNPNKWNNLYGGDIGKVLYYFYRAGFSNDETILDKGHKLLSQVLNIVAERKDLKIWNCSLGSGLSGLGMTLEALMNEGFLDDEFEQYLLKIDELVYNGAIEKIKRGDTDFLHGGSGAFHYLFYRLPKNSRVKNYLTEFVLCLDQIAVEFKDTLYIPNQFLTSINYSKPGEVNLGLAHGMISPLLILTNLLKKGIAPEVTSALIEKGIEFILLFFNSKYYRAGSYSHFPNSIFVGEKKYSSQNLEHYRGGLRWCYGDMNVAHLLYKASQILENSEWQDVADRTGLSTLQIKDLGRAKCHRSYFCHGTSGVAYYYKYLFRISGVEKYLIGYRHWLEKTFELLDKELEDEKIASKSGEFLEGFVGTSLVLMAESNADGPLWEKIWLLD